MTMFHTSARRVLFAVATSCFSIVLAGCSPMSNTEPAAAEAPGAVHTGVFYGVEGLTYETGTLSGLTNARGEFQYRTGETVTFKVGDLVIGSAPGSREPMTVAHLVLGVNGDVTKIKKPHSTNLARFLHSLDADGNVENGIVLTDRVYEVVSRYRHKIVFDQSETNFASDAGVSSLFKELGLRLQSPPEARNHLRRTLFGIQKETDVQIPTRDGNYVLADVYRPIAEGRYPAIVGIGAYGKAPYRGCICNQDERLAKAVTEDRFFEGNVDHHAYENHETADSSYWVPKGYAVVKIDGRGVCNTPGLMNPYSVQEAEDFYDSIEWAASRDWANGSVGTWGASYFGINQPIVASLQPPSLKAMVVSAGDSNRYHEVLFTGGISNAIGRENWWENSVKPNRCLAQDTFDRMALQHANPFDEPAAYGNYYDDPQPPGEIAADMSKVTVPMLVEVPLSHTGHQHVRGSVVTYIDAASQHKNLSLITGDFINGWMYTGPALSHHLAFFNRWLKGEPNDVMDRPKVKMMIRTGDGGWYWQYEDEFPVARTEYRKFYLDGAPSDWPGDGNRSDFMTLSGAEASRELSKTYSADVNRGVDPCWASGVSFVTEPLTEDVVLAGWIKLVAWVSSTSSDMDLFASVRVFDETGQEIPFALRGGFGRYPVGKGALKVSHRQLDPEKSTIFRPFHTHRKADYAPLQGDNEVVQVEVELEPTTALVRRGYRIRLDVQPVDGCDWGTPHVYDASYHKGASNTISMGPEHQSYLQLPVVPPKEARRTETND